MGNHEHYHGRFDRTKTELEEILPKNVRILENEFEIYNGVLYLGATLWTDCDRGNPISLHQIKYGMNDFRYIKNHYVNKNVYYNLTPEHTVDVHRSTLKYFREVLTEHSSMPCVVITHHAPSHLSIHPRYINAPMNGAYVSDLSNFILDTDKYQDELRQNNIDFVQRKLNNARNMYAQIAYILEHPRDFKSFDEVELKKQMAYLDNKILELKDFIIKSYQFLNQIEDVNQVQIDLEFELPEMRKLAERRVESRGLKVNCETKQSEFCGVEKYKEQKSSV
jgi:hypothetical protein